MDPGSHDRGVEEPSIKPRIAFPGSGTFLCSEGGGDEVQCSQQEATLQVSYGHRTHHELSHSMQWVSYADYQWKVLHLLVKPLSGEKTAGVICSVASRLHAFRPPLPPVS